MWNWLAFGTHSPREGEGKPWSFLCLPSRAEGHCVLAIHTLLGSQGTRGEDPLPLLPVGSDMMSWRSLWPQKSVCRRPQFQGSIPQPVLLITPAYHQPSHLLGPRLGMTPAVTQETDSGQEASISGHEGCPPAEGAEAWQWEKSAALSWVHAPPNFGRRGLLTQVPSRSHCRSFL